MIFIHPRQYNLSSVFCIFILCMSWMPYKNGPKWEKVFPTDHDTN
uniref:Uncharacterized protein n=1 Tax=Anguilla anguilla TaxID=7936 RepID=A0A0E9WAI4_ANGAN